MIDGSAPAERRHRRIGAALRRWRPWAAGLRYLAMSALAAAFAAPTILMLSASFRPLGLPPPTRLEWWPPEATLANYPTLFALLPLGRYALNSFLVVAAAVPLTLLTASWAAFAMTRLPPRPRRALVVASAAALLVPLMSLWLPRFLIFRWLGVLDTLAVLILPAGLGGGPFFVLILFWAFRRLPPELAEAAVVDGCGAFRTWWSVAIPLVRPALAAVGVLASVSYWSDFIGPLLYISGQDNQTLPVALQALQQMHPSRWPLLMAGAVVMTAPVVVAFALAQRFFLEEHRGIGWLGR